ncbi:MAG: bifunctional folylpolyglutamate synthase/dihydrofolate synthase [Planctomycetes bacterium]|nr:bifunctional folylpolyglutamate synthase/dihydrofolate synthase [Planctomycetota bacterium]
MESRPSRPAAAFEPHFRSFADATRYLAAFTNYEKQTSIPYGPSTYNLDRMRALCRALGDPQDRIPAIHITGTKGKGSTAAMVASVLQAHGYRVGLYTSPHLLALEERIRVDGEPIARREFVRGMNALAPHLAALRMGEVEGADAGRATFFEILTALAFRHFVQAGVQFAVLEVGLGGRLDATNVLAAPAACAVTCVDFDHMDKLGDTLAAIAREKAGIAKSGCPLVTGESRAEPLAEIRRACAKLRAPLVRVGRDLDLAAWRPEWKDGRPGGAVEVRGRLRSAYRLHVPLAGRHQAANAAVAVGLLEVLEERGLLRLRPSALREGFRRVEARARVEVVRPSPWPGGPGLVVDSAHNPVSIRALLEALAAYPAFAARGRVLVLAASRDKEPERFLFAADGARAVVCTRFRGPRACEPEELRDLLARSGRAFALGLHVARTPALALRRARALASKRAWIVATGSFYLAGEVLAGLRSRRARDPHEVRRIRAVRNPTRRDASAY